MASSTTAPCVLLQVAPPNLQPSYWLLVLFYVGLVILSRAESVCVFVSKVTDGSSPPCCWGTTRWTQGWPKEARVGWQGARAGRKHPAGMALRAGPRTATTTTRDAILNVWEATGTGRWDTGNATATFIPARAPRTRTSSQTRNARTTSWSLWRRTLWVEHSNILWWLIVKKNSNHLWLCMLQVDLNNLNSEIFTWYYLILHITKHMSFSCSLPSTLKQLESRELSCVQWLHMLECGVNPNPD